MCVRKGNFFFMCFLLYLILISYYYRNTNLLIFSTIFYFSGSVVCCVIFNWDENNNNNEILIIENIIQENMIEESENEDFSYIELTAEETKNIPDSFECCICLEEKNFSHNENNENKIKLIKLSCNHIFHEKCIKKWIQKDSTCPLCRFDL